MKTKKSPQGRSLHSAFTLVELIFVIIIIGIMAGVGSSAFKPKYLLEDTNFIVAKIQEAQFLAIGYEHNNFGEEETVADYKKGCVLFKNVNLSESADNPNEVYYKLHVTLDGDLKDKTLCFDSKGRPHEGDFRQSTLLNVQKKLILKYLGNERNITIEPVTGFIFISQ